MYLSLNCLHKVLKKTWTLHYSISLHEMLRCQTIKQKKKVQ